MEVQDKKAFDVYYGLDGCDHFDLWENNRLIALFSEIRFHLEGSDDPYATYAYRYVSSACEGFPAPCNSDDDRYVHMSSNGTLERLFVESPDRPFYLERDKIDPDLAKIVITFAPSTEFSSEREAE